MRDLDATRGSGINKKPTLSVSGTNGSADVCFVFEVYVGFDLRYPIPA
jgi:hypothetical protein